MRPDMWEACVVSVLITLAAFVPPEEHGLVGKRGGRNKLAWLTVRYSLTRTIFDIAVKDFQLRAQTRALATSRVDRLKWILDTKAASEISTTGDVPQMNVRWKAHVVKPLKLRV